MRRVFPYGFKQAGAVLALGCIVAASFAAIDAPSASDVRADLVSVNRANKGDRWMSVAPPTAQLNVSASPETLLTSHKRPPFGCDPLFSPIAEPARAHIYHRCAA